MARHRKLGPNDERVTNIDGWYPVSQAAKELGVSYSGLDSFIDRRQVRTKVISSTRFIRLDSVQEFVDLSRVRRRWDAMKIPDKRAESED